MIVPEVYERFANQRPVAVMYRGLLENVYSQENIDQIFAENAARQRVSSELFFSSVTRVLGLAVCNVRRTVSDAYNREKDQFSVSLTSVYNKLNGAEAGVSQALVRQTAEPLRGVIRELGTTRPAPLPGYRTKILDGKHLSGTERRLEGTRQSSAAPLPGQALVVLEPELMLATDVFPCEDAHAQERSLLPEVLETVQSRDLWIGDRNFCTHHFAVGLADRNAKYILREHAQNLPYEPLGGETHVGRIETGTVYVQTIRLTHREEGQVRHLAARRVTLELDKKTRHGQETIHLITNLPVEDADPREVARLYADRWQVEHAFQEISTALEGEINTLAYPEAALLGFCLALISYNLLSTVKAGLRTAHGEQAAPENISGYYLAGEVTAIHDSLSVALDKSYWEDRFADLTPRELANELRDLAARTPICRYLKHRSRRRNRPKKRKHDKHTPHISTARVLAQRQQSSSPQNG